jgi:hypothetical protein
MYLIQNTPMPLAPLSYKNHITILHKRLKLLKYLDRRIKPIVLVMVSSGIRVGAWNYLNGEILYPLQEINNNRSAKMKVYNTKTNCFVI